MTRADGRSFDEMRSIKLTRNFITHPEGSVLIEIGNTKVICNATVEDTVPPFLKGSGSGWITAEYSMLPRATGTRNQRDISKLRQNARSVEIQRLIGRALRMAVDLNKLGERSVIIDCDVIQADGGTRAASISGGFVALYDALGKLTDSGVIKDFPIINHISAVSVGIVEGEHVLDLDYSEDSTAFADVNVVMNEKGMIAEIQGTGEHALFSGSDLSKLIMLAEKGNSAIVEQQKKALCL